MDALSGLTAAASTGSQIGISMLKKGMDQQSTEMAQLLQAMPPAPQPAHLGSIFDSHA